ncbi:MAG: hypothetical protein WDO14_11110 [Bacteroidota bacterium]
MTREKAIETIKELPQEFELDALFERLLFIDKVEKGLEQIKQGKTISNEEVKSKIQQWKKSNGQS